MSDCVDAVSNGIKPIGTVKTAIPHVDLIERIYKTTPICNFKKEHIHINEEKDAVYVQGLLEQIRNSYENEIMFSETNSILFKK